MFSIFKKNSPEPSLYVTHVCAMVNAERGHEPLNTLGVDTKVDEKKGIITVTFAGDPDMKLTNNKSQIPIVKNSDYYTVTFSVNPDNGTIESTNRKDNIELLKKNFPEVLKELDRCVEAGQISVVDFKANEEERRKKMQPGGGK